MRFVARVFTPGERRIILDGIFDPDLVLWSIWAGKETGYKAVQRSFPGISSTPHRYEVELSFADLIPESGIVYTPCGPLSMRFFVTEDYVHCIGAATIEELDAIVWSVREMPGMSSSCSEAFFVRKIAKEGISECLGVKPEEVRIVRKAKSGCLSPPLVIIPNEASSVVNLSMSHDGRFAACAFSIERCKLDNPVN